MSTPAMPAFSAKMKRLLAALILLASFSSVADEDVSIGRYAAEVRSRVVAKVHEALETDTQLAKMSGIVTFVGDGVFFLQKGQDGLKVLARGTLPSAGDEVRVEGKPSLEGGRVVFVATRWKCRGKKPLPLAQPVTKDALITGDRAGVNWLRISVEGRAIGLTENGFAMRVDDVPVNVVVSPLPSFVRRCDQMHPRLRVTGVAELMLDQSVLAGRESYVLGVKIDVCEPKDIELKPDAAYLAACHARVVMTTVMLLAGMLVVGLLGLAIVIFRQRRGLFQTQTIMAERKRMADDIHDTIEQHLVGAGMLLKINRLKEAQDVLVRAKREIRDIVWGLKNDDMMRLTPAEMVRKLAHDENLKGLFRVDTRLEGLPAHLEASAMRDLSLIIRETIGNAVKHGGAKHLAISSDPTPQGGWILRVSNDGKPFDPAVAPGVKEGHFGLEGMRQRARRLGATLSFAPRRQGMVMSLTHESPTQAFA